MNIWTPGERTEWEDGVQEIEPTHRAQQLPDGRLIHESRLTLSEEWMEQLWQGYRCAACLERLPEPYPEHCLNSWCGFPVRAEQRRRLEADFVEQTRPGLVAGFPLDRERAHLEREQYVKKGSVTPGKEL